MTITSVPFGDTPLNRRSLLKAATITGGAVALGDLFPAWAKSGSHGLRSLAGQSGVVSGETIDHDARTLFALLLQQANLALGAMK